MIPVKFFNPLGNHRWYITEIEDDGDLAFGFCNLGDDEMAERGYMYIREIETIKLTCG